MNSVNVTKKGHYNVIVVGGGIAGVSAAVSAAREGMSVLIIEKQVNLGGLATGGLISWYEPLCNGEGEQIVFGIAEELIKLTAKYCYDSLPEKWGGTERSEPRRDRYATRFSPTVYSLALDEYVLQNGAELLFDTLATYPVMEGNVCKGVIVENVSGREEYSADVVIDATGTAAIMHRAGVPCVEGQNFATYTVHKINDEIIDEYKQNAITWKLRDWDGAGSDMNGVGHPEEERLISGTDAKEASDYIVRGKMRMLKKLKEWDRYSFDLMSIPTMPQFRTIRHIVGDSDFKADTEVSFPDSIGRLTDFRSNKIPKTYDFPLSALYNSDFPNLLAAGRIISTSTRDGWEVARVIPSCAKTGEEAGKAAARYVKTGKFSK